MEFVLYAVLALSLSLCIHRMTDGDLRLLIRRPLTLFLCAVVLVHGVLPLLQLAVGYQRYHATYALGAHLLACSIVLLYVVPCILMYGVLEKPCQRRLPRYDVALPKVLSSSGKHVIFWFLLVPSVAASLAVARDILNIGFAEYLSDRINYTAGRGYLILSSRILSVAYLAFLVHGLRGGVGFPGSGRKAWPLFGIMVGFFAFTGNRNSIFITLLCALLCYLMLGFTRPVRLRLVHVVALAVAVYGFSYLATCAGRSSPSAPPALR